MVALTSGVTVPVDVADAVDQNLTEPVVATAPRAAHPRRASDPTLDTDRYAVGPPIGRGGMGEVVSAHDVQIGREVAIKRLHAPAPTPNMRARFLREARIQGRLEHPSIPPVYELARDDDGAPYFVMRKLDGITLGATLRDVNSPFTLQRLLRAFVDVCNAVDLAHSRRIIHRDLKPANILLGERGETYVLDWGIARELDAPDAFAGPALGTPGYMAPEQIRAETDLDERVDIYSLGCILFEILARRPLHPRGADANQSALAGKFPAVCDFPPELAEACRRATSIDRGERYRSVRALMSIVQGYLDGDRDLEQRRALARQHLSRAQAALVGSDEEQSRRSIAMREAGQALALDPTLSQAGELISRIMLEAPREMPVAVEREIDRLDDTSARTVGNLSCLASAVFLVMMVVVILLGVRDVPYLTAYGVLSVAMLGFACAHKQWQAPVLMGGFLVSMILMFGLAARMFTPVLAAPALAATYLTTMPLNPTVARGGMLFLVTLGSLVAIFGVWAAEWVGWLSQTTFFFGDKLILRSPVDGMQEVPALPLIGTTIAVVIVVGATFSYVAMRQFRRARAQLVLQAWHLRQLAPTEQRAHDA
jgi:serine/threonine-protein kinase